MTEQTGNTSRGGKMQEQSHAEAHTPIVGLIGEETSKCRVPEIAAKIGLETTRCVVSLGQAPSFQSAPGLETETNENTLARNAPPTSVNLGALVSETVLEPKSRRSRPKLLSESAPRTKTAMRNYHIQARRQRIIQDLLAVKHVKPPKS